jgi:hypothetical protein
MAIVYQWDILTLEHEISNGGVFVASWKCSGGATGSGDDTITYSAYSYGSCTFTFDASSSDFTPYADLTQAQVQDWVWEKVNKTDTQADIAANINAQISATSAGGVPW